MGVALQQLQDAGSSLTGSIHKAVLCVPRAHFRKAAPAPGTLTQLQGTEAVSSAISAAASAGLQSLMRAQTSAASSFSKVKRAAGNNFCTMRVQYNPASISILSSADAAVHDGGIGDAGANDNTQITKPPVTTMTVTLVFDAVNVKDAFQWEKYRPSANDLIQGATALANRKSYRVDEQVNALLALTVHGALRHVVFHWSSLTFEGELTNVSAVYTMFSPSGRPIAANVTLTLRQEQESYENGGEDYWDSAYQKLFGDPKMNMTLQAKSGPERAQSLLNLNI